MLAHVFVKRTRDEDSDYTNIAFRIQGVGLNGTVPVRVCYFGKPVMEPVMVRVIDSVTKQPKLDKDGKPVFAEKKDDDGNTVMQVKKDENGKEIQRDENYRDRVEVLAMYSGNWDKFVENGEACDPVEIIAKTRSVQNAGGDKYIYFAVCGNEEVPIEVPDFSTADRPDYRYRSNCRKLGAMAKRV